jgi:2-amino-4-hydroxy-6-hydroxymethyldihydropteridine diphosphokinase
MAHVTLISLGSNLGDRLNNLNGALESLRRTPGVTVCEVSRFRETEPVGGPPGQGVFLNAVAMLETDLEPIALLHRLQDIENQFGRERAVRWGARTLDLDLLLFDDQTSGTPELQLPHPRMRTRRFVLEPLVEVAPAAVDPVTGRTFAEILAELIATSSE